MIRTALLLGTLGAGAYLYYGETALPKFNVSQTSDPIHACETLAAHPADPGLPAGIRGVTDAELDGKSAFEHCRVAYEKDNRDIRSAWHLGRAMLEMGAFDEGWPYIEYAAAEGLAPAIHLFARVLEDNDAAPIEQILKLYSDAEKAGFAPAGDDIARLTDASFDFDGYSQPKLIRDLVNGDTAQVLAFRINVPHEALGLRSGLVRYVAGFSDTFSGPWFCPGSLPAGLPEQIEHHAKWTALEEAIQVVRQPEIITVWLKETAQDPKKMGIELIEAEMRLNVARKAGERDAAVLAEHGCDHVAVAKIGETLEGVVKTLGH